MAVTDQYNIAVFGAGSGGIGAALAALGLDISVALIETADSIGGTAVRGGVHVWEPCAGSTGIPFDIYRRLKQIPLAVGIYSYGRHRSWHKDSNQPAFPGGEYVMDATQRYLNTLQRHGVAGIIGCESFVRRYFHGVVFKPEAYIHVVEEMLNSYRKARLFKQTGFTQIDDADGVIRSVTLTDGRIIQADVFVDATGDGRLCLACGCEALTGRDSRGRFNEPDAPEHPDAFLNAVTLIYRVSPASQPGIMPPPPDIQEDCWWHDRFPAVVATQCPWGDYQMNMLPTMEGREFMNMEYEQAYAECRRRVLAHWHYCQTIFPEFRGYRLAWIAPALGVRESHRIVCDYMLTENDILAGLHQQSHPDIIALADHALDRHGDNVGEYPIMKMPYGVPYRCLIPKGRQNLLIACRASGFSSLAASSCRLSRTMLQLGQAAGTAAALAVQKSLPAAKVPPDELRRMLRKQHVQLDWPMPPELKAYITNE